MTMSFDRCRRLAASWLMAAALGLLAGSCATGAELPAEAPEGEKAALFVNITSGKQDVHAASMGLGLARSALERGHDVVVFLNVHGAELASAELGDDVRMSGFPPVKAMLREILRAGGRLIVCGHCADVLQLDRSSLLPGVTIAHEGDILDAMEPGMVGISY